MRIIIAGAGHVSEVFASQLKDQKHEIVIIDRNRSRLDELSTKLDVSFLCGSATDPQILREADPSRSDILVCLTDSDETNLICAALGRALGIDRVIPSISTPDLEMLLDELGFDEFVTPASTVAQHLQSMLDLQD